MIRSAWTISIDSARVFGDFGEVPAVLHLECREVLVDGGEFAGQLLIEQLQHIGSPACGLLIFVLCLPVGEPQLKQHHPPLPADDSKDTRCTCLQWRDL